MKFVMENQLFGVELKEKHTHLLEIICGCNLYPVTNTIQRGFTLSTQ